MAGKPQRLAFERPIYELEARLEKLEGASDASPESADEIRRLRRQLTDLIKKIYSELEPWQIVQVARDQDRPTTTDYLELVFDDFVELHGDRSFGDDRAIRSGFAKLDQYKVLVVGHEKGKTVKQRAACNWGMAHPEGYRKAMGKMKLAAKFGMPVICLIDTKGAYPGIGAEERGTAQIIATNMFEMSRLRTPIICVVIGEGGSGGAVAMGVGDRIAILEFAYYSVISPEGCAGILWRSGEFAQQAAKSLKMTSRDLISLGVVDDLIEEPLGGAHRDDHAMAARLKMYLIRTLRELLARPIDQLVENRYQKFRRMGVVLDNAEAAEPQAATKLSAEAATDA